MGVRKAQYPHLLLLFCPGLEWEDEGREADEEGILQQLGRREHAHPLPDCGGDREVSLP